MYVSFIQIDFISLFLLSPQILIKLRKMRLKNSIAFGLFLALVCPACKQNRNVQQGAGNDYLLLTLTREDRKLSVKYSAVIEGKQDVEIRPQVSGFITRCTGKRGCVCKQRRHSLCHRPGSLSGSVVESRSQRCIGRSQPGHRTADIGGETTAIRRKSRFGL